MAVCGCDCSGPVWRRDMGSVVSCVPGPRLAVWCGRHSGHGQSRRIAPCSWQRDAVVSRVSVGGAVPKCRAHSPRPQLGTTQHAHTSLRQRRRPRRCSHLSAMPPAADGAESVCGDSGEMDLMRRGAPGALDCTDDTAGPDEAPPPDAVTAADVSESVCVEMPVAEWSIACPLTDVCVNGPEVLGPVVTGVWSVTWVWMRRRCIAPLSDPSVSGLTGVVSASSTVVAARASGSWV